MSNARHRRFDFSGRMPMFGGVETNFAPCDRCGDPSAVEVDDQRLCGSCFHETGSCCGSFGGNDEGGEPVKEGGLGENAV